MSSKNFPVMMVAVMVLISLIAYPFLPDQSPVHWNLQGYPDRMADKLVGVFMVPLISLILIVFMRLIKNRAFDPTYAVETHVYIINTIALFLGFMHIAALGAALNPDFSMVKAITVGIGALFAFMGNVMTRLRPNPYFGFRTTWTLTDDEVWRKTHRIGGRGMVVYGIVLMFAALVLSPGLNFLVMLGLLFGGTIGMMWYARQLWQQRHTTASN